MKIKDRLEEWAFDAFPKSNTFTYLQKPVNQVLLDKVRMHLELKNHLWFLPSYFYWSKYSILRYSGLSDQKQTQEKSWNVDWDQVGPN